MARFGTNFTGKNSPKKESSSQPTFPFHVAEPAADKKEELSPRESSQEAPAGEAPKITKSEDKDAEIDDSLLAGDIRHVVDEDDAVQLSGVHDLEAEVVGHEAVVVGQVELDAVAHAHISGIVLVGDGDAGILRQPGVLTSRSFAVEYLERKMFHI